MRAIFIFNESKIVNNFLSVEIDWNCPFLPRIGEVINPSILMLKLTPKEFYQSLSEEAKIEWDEWVKKRLDYYEGSIEKAEKGCMTEWLLDMNMCVREIFWDIDERGYNVSFFIGEINNILE
jgi:hypothetical protein